MSPLLVPIYRCLYIYFSDKEAAELVVNVEQVCLGESSPERMQAQNLTKVRPAAAPRTPRCIKPQPEDDFSDSSGGMTAYYDNPWYSPAEENSYHPGRYITPS